MPDRTRDREGNALPDQLWLHEEVLSLIEYAPTTELIRLHERRTAICSFKKHMIRASGPYYKEIVRRIKSNYAALDDTLRYLRDEEAGMSVMILLWDGTGVDPTKEAQSHPTDGWTAWNVSEARNAWLKWSEGGGRVRRKHHFFNDTPIVVIDRAELSMSGPSVLVEWPNGDRSWLGAEEVRGQPKSRSACPECESTEHDNG